jgi:hypothetical protein
MVFPVPVKFIPNVVAGTTPFTVKTVPAPDKVSVLLASVNESELMLVLAESVGAFAVVGIVTSSAAPGTTPPLQFVAVAQAVEVVPVQEIADISS